MADQTTMQQQPPSGQQQQPPGEWQQAPPQGAGPGGQDTTKAWVAYVLTWITGLIILLTAEKDDKYTRFHAIQAIGYGIAAAVLLIAVGMFMGIMAVSNPAAAAALSLFSLAAWALVILGIVLLALKASKGEMYELPVIGKIAREKA